MIACSRAMENARRMGRKPPRTPGCTQLWGTVGLKGFIPRLAASCPALPLGHRVPPLHVSGFLQGELSLLMYLCPLLPALQTCFLCSAVSTVLLRPLFTFQKLAEACLPLTALSNSCPCDLAIIYKIVILYRHFCENLQRRGVEGMQSAHCIWLGVS